MKDLEQKLHQQFPEAKDKCVEVVATELEIYDDSEYEVKVEEIYENGLSYSEAEQLAVEKCVKRHKTPKGYLAVTTTDNTLYLVKV